MAPIPDKAWTDLPPNAGLVVALKWQKVLQDGKPRI
jgi:hypothetical protein